MESRSGDVRVRDLAGSLDARSGHGRIEVTQAREARLQTSSGDVQARGIGGRVEASTGHGSVLIAECVGPVQAESRSGDVRISRIESPVSASTGHGSIEAVEIAEAALRTSSGDVRARGVTGGLEAHTGHGAIEIEGCGGEVTVESRSGDLRLRQLSGPVRATTGHGAIIAALAPAAGVAQIELAGNGGIDLTLPGTVSARLEARQAAAASRCSRKPVPSSTRAARGWRPFWEMGTAGSVSARGLGTFASGWPANSSASRGCQRPRSWRGWH